MNRSFYKEAWLQALIPSLRSNPATLKLGEQLVRRSVINGEPSAVPSSFLDRTTPIKKRKQKGEGE